MSCPPAIAQAIQAILALGLLRVRAAAWSGDVERCDWEADHLHNLPGLLGDYSAEKLGYYWQAERAGYLKRCQEAGVDAQEFEAAWKVMSRQLQAAA